MTRRSTVTHLSIHSEQNYHGFTLAIACQLLPKQKVRDDYQSETPSGRSGEDSWSDKGTSDPNKGSLGYNMFPSLSLTNIPLSKSFPADHGQKRCCAFSERSLSSLWFSLNVESKEEDAAKWTISDSFIKTYFILVSRITWFRARENAINHT